MNELARPAQLAAGAWKRYVRGFGSPMAGAIAFASFFALFPAVGFGATVVGRILRDRPGVQQRLVDGVNQAVAFPLLGLHPEDQATVQASHLMAPGLFSWTSLFVLTALVIGGVNWIAALRAGMCAMFWVEPAPQHPVWGKAADAGRMLALGSGVFFSALAGALAALTSDSLLRALGWADSAGAIWGTRIGVLVLLLFVDAALVLVMQAVLVPARVTWADLLPGAMAWAGANAVIRAVAGLIFWWVSQANAAVAVGVSAVMLLVWFNVIARVLLLCVALSATLLEAQTPAGLSQPAAQGPLQPSFGRPSADVVAISAGAVLGAGAMLALHGVLNLRRPRDRRLR